MRTAGNFVSQKSSSAARCDVTAQVETKQTETGAIVEALQGVEHPQTVSPGSVLFREGDDPRGVYFIRDGWFDLVYASRLGDSKPLRTAGPGQVLGLSCVVSNKAHDCSATARTPSNVGFITREDFARMLDENPDLWLSVLQMISSDISSCWDCMRSLGRC
jgi:CRP-like cAMP-binding protein